MRVFVDERMEKNKGKPRERKEKLKRIYDHEARKIRKQLSIVKAKIERLEKKKTGRSGKKEGKIGLSSKKNAKPSLWQV